MEWIVFGMASLHIVLGFLCGRLAMDLERRPEPWFFAGALLGFMALVFLIATSARKPIPGTR